MDKGAVTKVNPKNVASLRNEASRLVTQLKRRASQDKLSRLRVVVDIRKRPPSPGSSPPPIKKQKTGLGTIATTFATDDDDGPRLSVPATSGKRKWEPSRVVAHDYQTVLISMQGTSHLLRFVSLCRQHCQRTMQTKSQQPPS